MTNLLLQNQTPTLIFRTEMTVHRLTQKIGFVLPAVSYNADFILFLSKGWIIMYFDSNSLFQGS